MVILETERLILREITLADAGDFYRIQTKAENMKFLNDPPENYSVEVERYYLGKHAENYYGKYGFGVWAVILKENEQLVGRCGLVFQEIEDSRELEISYLIDHHYWRRGLATEICKPVLNLAHQKFNFNRIVAIIHPQNIASIRVAEKIGMKYERDIKFKKYESVFLYTSVL